MFIHHMMFQLSNVYLHSSHGSQKKGLLGGEKAADNETEGIKVFLAHLIQNWLDHFLSVQGPLVPEGFFILVASEP